MSSKSYVVEVFRDCMVWRLCSSVRAGVECDGYSKEEQNTVVYICDYKYTFRVGLEATESGYLWRRSMSPPLSAAP